MRERTAAMSGVFISSVGTGIGKTLVTAILCHQLRRAGRPVSAIKPVVSGYSPADPASDPALILRSLDLEPTPESIAEITPWRFAAPLSPHLAARLEGCRLQIEDVADFCRDKCLGNDGVLLIEGAGGMMTPINEVQTNLDLMALLAIPLILVTGSYLGALSHTLTALLAARGRGVVVRGIIVSESDTSVGLADTVASLRQFAGSDVQVYSLPRLKGSDGEKWRSAPNLTALSVSMSLRRETL
jgi:dethiobiotin synthetase